MKPKILKVELSEDDQNEILKTLIDKFDLNSSDIWGIGQEITFSITDEIEAWSRVVLYRDGYLEEDTNAPIIVEQSVSNFEFDLFIDGESIEYQLSDVQFISKIDGKTYMTRGEEFKERIKEHYHI